MYIFPLARELIGFLLFSLLETLLVQFTRSKLNVVQIHAYSPSKKTASNIIFPISVNGITFCPVIEAK